MWARPMSESMTAHDTTSQIMAQLSDNSPFVTGKNKRVGVSSTRLNPATRGAARHDEARRGEVGGGGGAREGLFSSQAPIACRRETLIRRSNSSSTSGVGLNFPLHLVPYNPHGPLEIFQKLLNGPRAHLKFQQSPTRSRGPIVSSVPITVSIYQCFSEDLLRLSFT